MGKLNNKVAVITGGAGGIGQGTAKKFLEEGAKVVIVDLDQEKLTEVTDELQDSGEIISVQADVSVEADVKAYIQAAVDKFGTIDIFFNNAGIEGKTGLLVDTDLEEFQKVMAVNVQGMFLGLKYALPVMIKQGSGSVINTSSIGGFTASPNVSPYVTSKHAIIGLTKAAAVEVAKDNIRVNSIHPSPVNTRMMDSLETNLSTSKEDFEKTIPLGRYAEPDDIANLVTFLASDDSTFITGAQYRIDGGIGAQ